MILKRKDSLPSNKRSKQLQTVLIEAAKVAPSWHPRRAEFYEKEIESGHRNRPTLAVARNLVAYIQSAEKRQSDFEPMIAELA